MSTTALAMALTAALIGRQPACTPYLVRPTPDQGLVDAALVARASHHDTRPRDLGVVMAERGWTIVWARPRDSEPGIFFFHGKSGAERFVDVWGGPTSDRQQAARWATGKVGAPISLAQCFAAKLIENGV